MRRPPTGPAVIAPVVRRATLASAAVGGAAFAYSLGRQHGPFPFLAIAALAAAATAAVYWRARRVPAIACAVVALVAASQLPGTLGFLALAAAAQVAVHSLSNDPRTWCWALAIGPASAACGLVFEPGAHWPLAFLAQLVLSLGAAPALSMAVRARWYDRRRPRELPPAELTRVRPTTGWILLPLVVVGAGFASLALDALPSPLGDHYKPRPRPRPEREQRVAEAERERERVEHPFADDMPLGEGFVDFTGRPVMQVWAARGDEALTGADGPLYLRGLSLDRFEARRVRVSDPELTPWFDETDGERDGWTTLDDEHPDAPHLRLTVYQRPLRVGVAGSYALFSPSPLLAVRAPMVLHSADVMTALPEAPHEWFQVELRARDHARWSPDLTGRSAHHPSPATRQLPPASPRRAELSRLAREVTAGANDDLARVAAVRRHFAAYDYELITSDLPGLDGVLALFDRGSGHCTHFAAASVLLLRSVGVSARVVTGYLAKDFDEESGSWIVSSRNGHAWIEVWFAGVGWVPFETTPMQRRERALAWSGGEGGLTSWAADVATDLQLWAESGGEARYLSFAVDTAKQLPEAAMTSARRRPFGTALCVLGAVALAAWWRARRRRADERPEAARARRVVSAPVIALERRWLQAFAALGFPRAPHQTWREFVAAVRARDPELADLLRPAAAAFEGAAYARRPIDDDARRALEAALADVRSRGPARPDDTAPQDSARAPAA